MIDLFLVILSLLFFAIIGMFVIKSFNFFSNNSELEKIPFIFGLGSALCALQLYVYSRFNIQWNILYLLIPWFIFIVFKAYKKNEQLLMFRKIRIYQLSTLDYLLVFLIVLLVGFVGFESVLRPLSAWDGWASWLFKAKMFYLDGSIKSSSIQYSQSDYPLVVSLIGTYIYIVLGKVNDTAVLLYFFACYLMLGIVFFTQLKKQTNMTVSLLFTFLLLSLQNLIRHGGRFEAGYADLPLAFYIFLSSSLIFEFLQKKEKTVFVFLNILLGITALIKNEGMFFSVIAQLIVFYNIYKNYKSYRTRLTTYIPCTLFWLIPIIDWTIFKFINKLPQNFLLENVQNHIHVNKILRIVIEFSNEFINLQNWNIMWIIFFVFLFFSIKKKRINLFYGLTLVQLLLYMIVFVISPVDPILHVKNIVDRLFIHVAPLAVFGVALTYYERS